MNALNYVTETLAGVVAVDGGTVGPSTSVAAFSGVAIGFTHSLNICDTVSHTPNENITFHGSYTCKHLV